MATFYEVVLPSIPTPTSMTAAQKRLWILSALLAAGFGAWLVVLDLKLETPAAPLRIVSLELAWSDANAKCIADSWAGANVTGVAKRSILVDVPFIIGYCLFLAMTAMALAGFTTYKGKAILLAIVLAGVCDFVENIFMWRYLSGGNVAAIWFSLPASIKFSLLFLVLVTFGYLLFDRFRQRLRFLTYVIAVLRMNAAGVIVLIVCYFVFINLPQGQDVLIQVAEYSGPLLYSLFSLLFLTFVLWYSARLVQFERAHGGDDTPDEYLDHAPRLISFNLLVAIQAAIVALPTIGRLSEIHIWIFIAAQNAVYALWHIWLARRRNRALVVVVAFLSAYAGTVIYFISRSLKTNADPHTIWLPVMAMVLCVYSLLIVWYFVRQRERLRQKTAASRALIHELRFMGVTAIKLREPLDVDEQRYFNLFNWVSIAGATLYVSAFFCLWLDDRMGPFAFALLAFGVLAGLSNMVSVYGIRKRANMFVLLFILALLLGRVYNPYNVRMEQCASTLERPDLKTYLDRWMSHREELIAKSDSFPVYLVIADGGASRSGYWVASVLSRLQDESVLAVRAGKQSSMFSDHLFCLAGASGGSVGNATFYALLRHQPSDDPSFLARSKNFLRQDFLTPVLTHWLGSDFFQHLVPMPFIGDRAAALENSMQYFSRDSLYSSFEKPFDEVADVSGKLPILFINSTHVQGGSPAVVSTVDLEGFSRRVDIVDSVARRNKSALRYSTAVAIGARFPYVSPAGYIGRDYFVDGGYFDNTGAGIVHETMQYLDSLVEGSASNPAYRKLRFSVLYISNYSLQAGTTERMHPVANDVAAPLLTVLGTYSSQTSVNNERLVKYMRKLNPERPFREVNLYVDKDTVDYPMNWVISAYNLRRMDRRTERFMDSSFVKFMPW